jgi:hypothetical protein
MPCVQRCAVLTSASRILRPAHPAHPETALLSTVFTAGNRAGARPFRFHTDAAPEDVGGQIHQLSGTKKPPSGLIRRSFHRMIFRRRPPCTVWATPYGVEKKPLLFASRPLARRHSVSRLEAARRSKRLARPRERNALQRPGRSLTRKTNLSADHVSLIAQTFTSTRPAANPM